MHKINNPKEKLAFFFGVLLYMALLRAHGATCAIRSLLSVPCPGCGMTRAFLSLLRWDLSAAFAYHPLFFLAPLLALYFLFDGKLFGRWADRILLCLMGAAFLTVWILRLVGVLVTL